MEVKGEGYNMVEVGVVDHRWCESIIGNYCERRYFRVVCVS